MIPIFVSIAQTLSDLKKYDEAVAYFMKELDCRHGEHKQVSGSFMYVLQLSYTNILCFHFSPLPQFKLITTSMMLNGSGQ